MAVINICRRTTSAALAGAAAPGVFTLTTCSGASAAGKDGKVDVVASFHPLRYAAERIGGSHVHVTDLTAPGVEPHDLELLPPSAWRTGHATGWPICPADSSSGC